MATDRAMTEAWDDLLRVLRPRWRQEWSHDLEIEEALAQLEDDARRGRPSSLPVVQSSPRISWLSVAASRRELREYLDDVRAWLLKVDAVGISGRVTVPSDSGGPLAPTLREVAPHGYVRWDTSEERGRDILRRLHRMHRFLATRPQLGHARVPSAAALRLEFVSSLKVGNWARAEASVNEIDHWNLDHASATLQMRIRLLDARGELEELFRFVQQHEAWHFTSPRRIAAAILNAVDACAIEPVEKRDGVQPAYELFRQAWYPRLVHVMADAKGEQRAIRLAAFACAVDGDRRSLVGLLPSLPEALAAFLRAQTLPSHEVEAVPEVESASPVSRLASSPVDSKQPAVFATPDSSRAATAVVGDESTYWNDLHQAIKVANTAYARVLLAVLETDILASDEFIAGASDGLLELLTDPAIDLHYETKTLRYEALAALVDCFVGAPSFPNLKHLEIYLSLLSGLVEVRGGAVSEADSQLVLGLGAAVATLSADECPKCEDAFRSLWRRRPVVPRLDWLVAALDTLAELHPTPQNLVDLFTDGLALAERKAVLMSRTKIAMWRRIGAALELSSEDLERLLGPLVEPESAERPDVLGTVGLKTIAIVSLREASAISAAKELEDRTGATVFVVASLVADDHTRHATGADLILYVWAASTHAAYRAFDKWRDKLEYVQGTGASSIVMAAERWAARRVHERELGSGATA
jgi:hypothetical protein